MLAFYFHYELSLLLTDTDIRFLIDLMKVKQNLTLSVT